MNPFTVYLKAHLAQLYALAISVMTVIQSSGHIDRASVVQVGLAILSAVGVYAASNTAGTVRRYTKAIIAFVGAGLSAGAPFIIAGHITYAQVTVVAVALAGAFHVFITPNAPAEIVLGKSARPFPPVPMPFPSATPVAFPPEPTTGPSSPSGVGSANPAPVGGPPADVAAPSVSPAVAAAQTAPAEPAAPVV